MPWQVIYKSYKLGKNVKMFKIIYLLSAPITSSVKPLFLTLTKNSNIFMKKLAKVKTKRALNKAHITTCHHCFTIHF